MCKNAADSNVLAIAPGSMIASQATGCVELGRIRERPIAGVTATAVSGYERKLSGGIQPKNGVKLGPRKIYVSVGIGRKSPNGAERNAQRRHG
jgi:hypothetical protein